MTQEYPLQWPPHIKRTPAFKQTSGRFQVSSDRAFEDLTDEIKRSGGTNLVVSTNMRMKADGYPYTRMNQPDDSGVAVYYMRKGKQVCIPCDSFQKVWENIRAVGLSIKDMRGPESRGCAQITDQAFDGFTALPPPDAMTPPPPTQKQWWEVLGVNRETPRTVWKAAYKALAREATEKELYLLNAAKDAAARENLS